MSLSTEQIEALLAPLSPGRVRQVQGNSHLEAWDDRRWLLRIFGWGGWATETLECALVSERSVWDETNPLKGRHSVIYRVQARLIIKDADGNEVTHFDDGATGDAQNQPSLGDAHDQALKTALSQALKRCAINLGDAFGLSLYSGGSTQAVVGRSIPHQATTEHVTQENVVGGEMAPAPSYAETSTVEVPSPAVDPAVAPPAVPSPDADQEALRAEGDQAAQLAVAALRVRVLEAIDLTRQDSIVTLGRVKIDAGKARLMNAMTTSPTGEPMTVGVLIDRAITAATKKRA